MKIGLIRFMFLIFIFVLSGEIQSQNNSDKNQQDEVIVGKWIKKIDRTKDGKEYFGLKCKDTVQYYANGTYLWNQCGIKETGKWKFSRNKLKLIYFERKNKYWEEYLNVNKIGNMEAPIVSFSREQIVKIIFDEEMGEVHQYYIRIE